jgi:hypothetical protein
VDSCGVVVLMTSLSRLVSAAAVCGGLDAEISKLSFRVSVRVLRVDDGSPDGLTG